MKKIIFILLISVVTHAAAQNLIESLSLEPHKISFYINKNLKDTYLSDDLFIEYENDIDLTQLDYTIYTLPLVLNVISTVWISGETYTIDAMDKELYESLKVVKEVFRRMYPKTDWQGELVPLTLVENLPTLSVKNNTITIPFSHGLDSVCTSIIHHDTPQLLLTARGMPDMSLGEKEDLRWEQTKNLMTHYASVHGHKNTYVYSNFHDFFNWKVLNNISPEIKQWRLYAVEDLGWMGLAAPILVTHGLTKLMLVSNIGGTAQHPGACCPMVDNNVAFAGISCKLDSFGKSRMDKNKAIAHICNTYNLEKPVTLVCERWLEDRKNCCKCQKCNVTLLSFLAIGEDHRQYGFEVDLTEFFDYYKNVHYHLNRYSSYRAGWNQDCQKVARERLHLMSPQLQEFFSWYNAIDFDKLTNPAPYITINYDDFTDLCDDIFEQLSTLHSKKGFSHEY